MPSAMSYMYDTFWVKIIKMFFTLIVYFIFKSKFIRDSFFIFLNKKGFDHPTKHTLENAF